MEHTPGPWQARQWVSGNWHITPVDTERPLIVTTEYQAVNGIDAPTEAANARLIAAAPDLLEACEALASQSWYYIGKVQACVSCGCDWETHGLHTHTHTCLVDDARAAIAKATA